MASSNFVESESSEESPAMGGFAGIGINFGADGQMSVIHGMPGNRPSPELMGLASMLMPMLANRVNKGKGGKGYNPDMPPSGVQVNALVHANLGVSTDSNEAGAAASSSRDPATEDQSMKDEDEKDDESKAPKEGKGSKKKQKKGKGKRAGKKKH